VTLIPHLRGKFGFGRTFRQLAGFGDRPSKGLLDIDMLADVHTRESDGGMHVIGSGDDDGVDVLLLVEHDAIIVVALGLRK